MRGYKKSWAGMLQYDNYTLGYIIAEERISQLCLMTVLAIGSPSEEGLEETLNELLDVFGLVEAPSQREPYKRQILNYEKYPPQ